jgi:CheY-like chemotaxis protein
MDVQMPEMDGLQATRAIRQKGPGQLLIIAMTANAMPEDYQECLAAGMDDYVSKPVRIETIKDMIAKWSTQPLIRPAG